MSVHALVDPEAVRRALEFAGEEVRDRKVLGEIMICEGRAFLLHYRWSDDGKQVKADFCLDGKDGPVRQAVERAGDRAFLPVGWVDQILPRLFGDGNSTGARFPTGMYPTWERPGLRVLAAPPHLLVPMAFLATLRPVEGLSAEETDPYVRVAAQAGINTPGRLRAMVAPYVEGEDDRDGERERAVERGLSFFGASLDHLGLGLALNSKPRTLAEVADIVRDDNDLYILASCEFEEAFYLTEDRDAQQAMLDPVPVPTGNTRTDAWLGATGEHLAQRWGLEVPPWTQEPAFMGERVPSFWPRQPVSRDIKLIETPPAFRRRLLFSWAEPLMNAKFPNARKVRMPFWT